MHSSAYRGNLNYAVTIEIGFDVWYPKTGPKFGHSMHGEVKVYGGEGSAQNNCFRTCSSPSIISAWNEKDSMRVAAKTIAQILKHYPELEVYEKFNRYLNIC